MREDQILIEMTAEKRSLINNFMAECLGHPPSVREKKKFTQMHGLHETKVYYTGVLVATLNFDVSGHKLVKCLPDKFSFFQ
jgi:hypothetical protein